MNKKTDLKNFRLQSVLSRQANDIMTIHPVKKEWRIAIVSLLTIKILTMFFSLFGGWAFFNYKFTNAFAGLDVLGLKSIVLISIFTIITLIAIELLTAVFLQKMFKFFYRGRFITAVAALLVVGLFYTISFISSTNGLASRQANKTDKIETINAEFEAKRTKAETELKETKARIISQIQTIKSNPQGWSQGKRSYMTAKQLADIDKLQTKIDKSNNNFHAQIALLDSQFLAASKINIENKAKTAKDYYKIMSIIMLLQFLATGIVVFFWYLIRNQESKDAVVSEDLKEISETVQNHAETLIFNTMVETSNKIHRNVASRINQNQYSDYNSLDPETQKALSAKMKELANQENATENETEKPKEAAQIIGFGIDNKSENKTEQKKEQKPAELLRRFEHTAILKNSDIQFLNKHKKLVSAIKNLHPQPAEIISNQQIIAVQKIAKKAPYKSKTTIQKVFTVMLSVGINRIDANGNFELKSES